MSQDIFPETVREAVAQVAGQLGKRAEALQAQADEAARGYDVWKRLSDHIGHGWSLHVLQTLRKHRQLVESIVTGRPELAAALHEIQSAAEQHSRLTIQRYPMLMEQFSNARGLTLDRTSRHPIYTFEDGFFKLAIDERNGTASLSDHEGALAEVSADVEAVLQTVEAEHKRVFARQFDGPKVLKRLRQQYIGVAAKEGRTDGDPIPIRHITRRLGKNAKGFRTDEFLVDLSRLLKAGPLEIDGRRLDLQQTKDTSQGMLLHGISASGYIGFVLFRRVE